MPDRPLAGDAIPVAVVNDKGAERWLGGHPWVYDSDLLGWEPAAPPDDRTAPVRLRSRRGDWLGLADFSPHSKIRLRRLSRDPALVPDSAWLHARLDAALAMRGQVVRDSDSYRLVSAEADDLPGLILDSYGDAVSLQTLTWAMDARQPAILAWIERSLNPRLIVERNDVPVRRLEGLEPRSGLLRGDDPVCEASINGLRFQLDLLEGQKTGGFLDQRENWAAVERHAAARGYADALDVFTYQGGFALHLARVCGRVEGVDSSRPALEAADANAQRNRLTNLEWTDANAFDLLREYERQERRFDVVVLDPPAFAKSRTAVASAAAAYKEINLRALKLLRPGGMLVSCSCSHHLGEAALIEILAAAARDARRTLTLVERRTQAQDHPILLAVPETFYLKCILAIAR